MGREEVNRELTDLKPELQELVKKIYSNIIVYNRLPMDMFEGKRSQERQQWLYDNKYSQTLNSNHKDGGAVDFVYCLDNKWSWDNSVLHYFDFLGERVLELYGDKIEWGGKCFGSFIDKPHFQLKRK